MQGKLFLTFLSILVLSSCNDRTVYSNWETFENNQWHKDSALTFEYLHKEIQVKEKIYDIEIELRNTKDYEFNNLFLKAEIIDPNDTTISLDTLEYQITDKSGKFIGTGISSIKDNALLYKENFKFQNNGLYIFRIGHLMRRLGEANGIEKLKGINAIGINIKHAQ